MDQVKKQLSDYKRKLENSVPYYEYTYEDGEKYMRREAAERVEKLTDSKYIELLEIKVKESEIKVKLEIQKYKELETKIETIKSCL